MPTENHEANARQWSTLKFTTGFYMADMVRSVLQFADTDERKAAIQKVHDLLEAGCTEEQTWRDSIETLGHLCRHHPEAYKESGFWYDGAPSILALALAKEAAVAAMYKLHPTLHTEAEIEGKIYKVFIYLLRSTAQSPEAAVHCLKWCERVLHHLPTPTERNFTFLVSLPSNLWNVSAALTCKILNQHLRDIKVTRVAHRGGDLADRFVIDVTSTRAQEETLKALGALSDIKSIENY